MMSLLLALVTTLAGQDAPAVSHVVKLTNIETSYPNWSPDGRRIVYQSNRTGNSEIYVMNADGSGVVQLTTHPAVDENPAWSPDGRRIAFRTYRDGNAEIYTMADDGTDLRNLTQHAADDIHPYWSPDGSRIVFNSNRAQINGKPVLMIFTMRSDGSDVTQISRDGFEETYAHFSPDGSRLVFRRRLEDETPGWERNPGNSDIYVMDSDGGNARRLTDHPGFDGWPSWSPDGAWITYAAEGAGDYQVAMIRPDGSGFQTLTEGPGNFTKPIFSRDGRRIICTRTLDGNVELFVIELAVARAGDFTPANPAALLERAATRMGGLAVLETLPPLITGYHLLERSVGQEEWPQGAAASSVQVGTREVLPHDSRERLQMRRHMSGGRIYDRTIDAGRWHRLSPPDSARGDTTTTEFALSAALAALHPESLLPGLLRRQALDATLQRPRMLQNQRVAAVQVHLAGMPITLLFDDGDGLLRAVEWRDSDLNPMDQRPIRVTFAQYRPTLASPGAARLPHLVEVWRGDSLWQVRSYDEYTPAPLTTFGPDRAAPPAVTLQENQVAPGVSHLRAADYSAMLVETAERVIVVDLPDSAERGRAILATARRRAGGRPITVVVTHLHDDHIGGLLSAGDLEVVANERILEDIRRIFVAHNVRLPALVGVRDLLRLGSGDNIVELRSIPHSHAVGMLVAFIPSTGLLYESDLVRGLLPHSTLEFVTWVQTAGLNVRSVLSSHGGAQAWERVVEAASSWQKKARRSW